jgi:hypothetical protein
LQSINVLKRELTKAFPDLTRHVEKTGEEWYSVVAAVVTPNGELIAPNAKEWFAEQTKAFGSDRLISRIRAEDLRLARYEGGYVYALGVELEGTLMTKPSRTEPSEAEAPPRGAFNALRTDL